MVGWLSDKVLGALLLVAGILVIAVYVWALFFAGSFAWLVAISVVAVIAVGAVCVIVAWIGYTLLTTPSPGELALEELRRKRQRKNN
jgi:MFS family permease